MRTTVYLAIFIIGVAVGFVLGLYIQSHQEVLESPTYTPIYSNATCTMDILLDNEYLETVLQMLQNVKKSVYVIMYVVKYDPEEPEDPVNTILHRLAELYRNGVDVRIVVDDETLKSYPETIDYVKSVGIPIKLDEKASTTTHTKMIIIDNNTAILGSHNWTESALTKNHEASVKISCPQIVEKAVSYFVEIWNSGRSLE